MSNVSSPRDDKIVSWPKGLDWKRSFCPLLKGRATTNPTPHHPTPSLMFSLLFLFRREGQKEQTWDSRDPAPALELGLELRRQKAAPYALSPELDALSAA